MPGDDAGSADEVLAALVASLRGELADSQAALTRALEELARARERIAELEARLGQTPRNSSKPPSSEGLDKPPPRPRSLRKRSGRKPGGQDGHEGTTLAQVARPDREVRHEPACCGRCGAGLAGRPVTGVERRQVFDMPEVKITVIEHQLMERECGCGHRTKGAAPQGAEAPVQYGPRIAAVIVYLYIGQFLSKQRTAQALAELFGIPLSSGTVAGITARAAGRLGRFLEYAREQIAASEVWGARTRAEHLTWASILGARALPPRLSAHDPVVRMASAACAQRRFEGRRDLGVAARDRGLAPPRRPAETGLG